MALKILLNYRRGDTAGNAGRLYEALATRFGDDNVFMDIDKIEPGLNFVDVIKQWVGRCDVFIAMIGTQWLDATYKSGQRRLDDPNDFVRMEIESALGRPDVRLIPVLVQDVDMPSADQLPDSMRALALRNGLEIRDVSWDYDVGRLIESLEKIGAPPERPPRLSEPTPTEPRPDGESDFDRRLMALAAAAALLVIAGILGFLHFRDGEPGTPPANAGIRTTGGDVPAGQLVFAADARLQTVGPEGKAEPLASRSGDHESDWSSDGTRLAVARLGDIVVLDAAGRPSGRPLTRGVHDNAPSWSPDGSQIVFDRPLPDGRSHLWIVDSKGDDRPFPPNDDKTGGQPDWSPDGTQIVFQRLGSLYVTPVGGGHEDLLELGVPGTPRDPAWSPTRSEIAFALTGDETGIYLYSFGQAGAARRVAKVTKPRYPAWSSDGERLVFTTVDGIWTVNRDGTGLRPVYKTNGQMLETPSWRPK